MRRVHQDRDLVVQAQAFEDSRSGVALHPQAVGFGEPDLLEESPHPRNALRAGCEGAITDNADLAGLDAALRRKRERDVEAVGAAETPPRDQAIPSIPPRRRQGRRSRARRAPPDRHPVEIGANHLISAAARTSASGEGRAWHFDGLVVREIADERPRESCLAGAEIARQRDQIAGFERDATSAMKRTVACSLANAT